MRMQQTQMQRLLMLVMLNEMLRTQTQIHLHVRQAAFAYAEEGGLQL